MTDEMISRLDQLHAGQVSVLGGATSRHYKGSSKRAGNALGVGAITPSPAACAAPPSGCARRTGAQPRSPSAVEPGYDGSARRPTCKPKWRRRFVDYPP
jgi:hypothetical protein